MPDNDDDYNICNEEENYGLEYYEDSNSEPDVDLENQYYKSKALKEDEPQAALLSFQKVLELEGDDKGEWRFKALKQIIKINFKLGNLSEMMTRYKQLLTYIKSAVTRNHSEKYINSILDYISTSTNMELLQVFYETTSETLKDANNYGLWFKTNTKLGKLYYDRGDFNKLAKILEQLHLSCQTVEGEDDLKKGTQLLEIYALEIQMYTATKNNKKLKALYEKSLHIKSAVPHSVIMGVIRECGGKMHLQEGEFEKAYTDFFEAFKNYDEFGSPRKTTCLKYLVLANMLMKSGIDPFDSQEAKPYKNEPGILAMTNLVMAYQNNDINEFESILNHMIMDDPFIKELIEDLLGNLRTQASIKLTGPYTRIQIPFISNDLNIDEKEVENKLVTCILDQVTLKFAVRDNKPVSVPQAFVRVAEGHSEAIFFAEHDNTKAYKVDLNVDAIAKHLNYTSGTYSVTVYLGDSVVSNHIAWLVGELHFNFDKDANVMEENGNGGEVSLGGAGRGPLPELQHEFRSPEARPPRLVSDVFAAACAAPLLLLLLLWAKLRVNLSLLPFSLSTLVFHVSLGGSLALYFVLWLRLSMLETFCYLLPLAALTFLSGHRLLRRTTRQGEVALDTHTHT